MLPIRRGKGILVDKMEHTLELYNVSVSVKDEYRFIKKYFNPFLVSYVLIFRLLSFHNPFVEIYGFISNLKVKRINPNKDQVNNEEIKNFDSQLLKNNLKVSVIIPTLNRYVYLNDVLSDLEKQTYKNFEVIICDQTDPFNGDIFKNRTVEVKVIKQEEKALWLARNKCVEMSRGELILLFDDDSRVDPDWIEMHIRCLDYYSADICSGISISKVGDKVPANYKCYRLSDQLDTGNAMLYKSVFTKVGLFDRQFEKMRMGDGEFGLRCHLAGLKNISSPDAKRIHLKVSEGGLRQMGSWDAFRTHKIFAPRPIPSVLYFSRKYFGAKNALLWLLISVPPSIIPYRFKSSSVLKYVGIIGFVLLLPLVFMQVMISWRKASKMINQGAEIAKLKSA